jgi:hypothetical protein
VTALVTTLLLIANTAWADEERGDRAIRLLKVFPVPVTAANTTAGGMYSFDISWVDQERQLYFLADRSNKVVDVVNAKTATFLKLYPAGAGGEFRPGREGRRCRERTFRQAEPLSCLRSTLHRAR